MNLAWRYLPGAWTANKVYQRAVIKNNAAVQDRIDAGVPVAEAGTSLSYTYLDEIRTNSYSEFSLAATYQVNDTLTIRAGIDNLFDVNSPDIGGTTG